MHMCMHIWSKRDTFCLLMYVLILNYVIMFVCRYIIYIYMYVYPHTYIYTYIDIDV